MPLLDNLAVWASILGLPVSLLGLQSKPPRNNARDIAVAGDIAAAPGSQVFGHNSIIVLRQPGAENGKTSVETAATQLEHLTFEMAEGEMWNERDEVRLVLKHIETVDDERQETHDCIVIELESDKFQFRPGSCCSRLGSNRYRMLATSRHSVDEFAITSISIHPSQQNLATIFVLWVTHINPVKRAANFSIALISGNRWQSSIGPAHCR